MSSREIARERIKMAMSLRGSKRYYNWFGSAFSLDHILATAELCDFSTVTMLDIVRETIEQTEQVIQSAKQLLPDDFPEDVSNPIFEGIQNSAKRLKKQLPL